MIRILLTAPALALALAPRAALACAVCRPGLDDPAQMGFLIGSVLLSVLPLLFVGAVVLAVWQRARRMAHEETAATGASSPALPIRTAPAQPAAR